MVSSFAIDLIRRNINQFCFVRADAGNVFGKTTLFFADPTTGFIFGIDRDQKFNLSDLRMSLGVSGIWMSPFGLLSVSFAQPFRDQAGDELQSFQFNFGAQF